ncbi:tape measure protein [Microbacterium phage Dewdrop]|nr:tape measure protein [Microbacterium phage Leaf]QGZ17444.1 tape measure protein [Microbacterium phage Dewdrop]
MSMGGPVGEAYIEVGAEDDTDQDLAAISRKLVNTLSNASRRAGREMVRQFADSADRAGNEMVRHLQDDFQVIQHQIDELTEDQVIKFEAEMHDAAARAEILWLARDRIVDLWVVVRGNAAAQLTAITKGLSGLNLITSWRDAVVNLAASLPQTIIRFALLGGAIASVVAPLMNVLSAIAPVGAALGEIFPLILAGPAALAAFAAQIGVVIAAFKDLENATGSAGKRAFTVLEGLKDRFSDLQDVIQENFWAGFIDPFERVVNALMPQLESGLSQLASVMGTVFGQVGDAIAGQLGTSGLHDFFANLSVGISNAGVGLAGFAAAFTRIMEQGATLFPKFGDWITRIGTSFNEWAQGADIAGIIERAAVQLGNLWNVAKNLWGVISGIFTAMDTGKSTGLDSLAVTLGKISDIVNGPAFQNGLRTIFEGGAEGASIMADALLPIGDSLEKLAPTIANLISSLSGGFASAVTQLFEALSTPVAQGGLNAAIEGLAGLLENIDWAAAGAAIGAIGAAIGTLAPLVTNLVNALLPFLAPIATGLATVGAVLSTLLTPIVSLLTPLLATKEAVIAIVSAFLLWKGISAVITGVQAAMALYQSVLVGVTAAQSGLTLAQGASKASFIGWAATVIAQSVSAAATWVASMVSMGATAVAQAAIAASAWVAGIARTVAALATQAAAFVAQKAVLIATTVATNAAAAAQWLLNAAMSANPIGIIITLIAALVGALIWFFTQTEVGQEIWSNFISFLTDAWTNISTFFSDIWNNIVTFFTEAVSNIVAFVTENWGLLLSILIGPLGLAIQWIVENWQGIMDWFNEVISGFVAWWNGIWTAVGSFISTVWTNIVTWVQGIWNGFISWITAVIVAFVAYWNASWSAVGKFISDVWNNIVNWVTTTWNGFINWITSVISAFVAYWNASWTAVGAFISQIWNNIVSWVQGVWNGFVGWIQGSLNGFVSFWSGIWNNVKNTAIAIWNGIIAWFRNIPNMIMDVFNGAATWLYNIGRDIVNGLFNGIKNMWDGMMSWIDGAVGGLIDTVGGLLGIASPSKVFAEMGRYVTEGFLEGISKLGDMASDSLNRQLKPLTQAVNVGLGDLNPTTSTRDEMGSTTTIDNSRNFGDVRVDGGPDPYKVAAEVANLAAEESDL